jgi:hypothetical protein
VEVRHRAGELALQRAVRPDRDGDVRPAGEREQVEGVVGGPAASTVPLTVPIPTSSAFGERGR